MPHLNDVPPHLADRVRKDIEQARTESLTREGLFLSAWKRGVKLAGPQYFKNKQLEHSGPLADVDSATNKWQLCPDRKAIRRAIGRISHGEAAFLGAMYSFYNSDDGHELLKRIGRPTIGHLAARLDLERARIIAELFLHYPGW